MITSFCKHDPNGTVAYRTSKQPYPGIVNGNRALNGIGPQLMPKQYTPVGASPCGGAAYQGINPLLIDPMRGQKLLLNRPHFESGIAPDLSNVYSPWIRSYGRGPNGGGYRDYSDINAGQYQYWVPKQPEVYFPPVFTKTSKIVHSIFTDPMDIQHPHWERVPNECRWDKCLSKQTVDSFTHDSLEFREQLMARQMRRENERDYSYRVM